ncbi:hypothetical protein XBKB1_2270006 [Xenorhabdus bovienii str. kraussei Becker Underwood]|uniref:Uncharacterized protein n=1 Tax=Xenorhabdus bovienii str. kraussei Becker Underwood TaxID=1398204 RepID=A0A077PHY9_XENBV|nr:hypothetical protein XBKB1_2270006 [Xenorhabdus bovienii str. kraussei Becker Underwood]
MNLYKIDIHICINKNKKHRATNYQQFNNKLLLLTLQLENNQKKIKKR